MVQIMATINLQDYNSLSQIPYNGFISQGANFPEFPELHLDL